MGNRLHRIGLLLLAGGAFAACAGSSGNGNDLGAGGGHDFAAAPDDLSAASSDLAVRDGSGRDGGGSGGFDGGGCVVVNTWPNLNPFATFDSNFSVTYELSTDQAMVSASNVLSVEDWHAGATYPKSVTFSSTDTYASTNACDVCVRLQDPTATDFNFFAQAGTATVTEADQDPANGRMKATLTNVKLVEWDFTNDVPVAGGRCFIINSDSFNVPWTANTDGGTGAQTLWFWGDFVTNNVSQVASWAPPAATTSPITLGSQVNAFDVTRDGSLLVVGADVTTTGQFDLYSVNPDGSSPQLLAAMPAAGRKVSDVRISPDGQWVAFVADIDGAGLRDVWIVPITGGTPVKLSPARPAGAATPTQLVPSQFDWSRDSQTVAIAGDYEVNSKEQLYLVAATVASPAPVTAITSAAIGANSGVGTSQTILWTAGGRAIFKARLSADAGFRLYGVDANGANLAQFTRFPAGAQVAGMGLSPDGTLLALGADSVAQPNAYELYTMPADDSAAPTLRSAGTLLSPASSHIGVDFFQPVYVSPDATKIAFVGDFVTTGREELFVVGATGSNAPIHVATVGTAGDATRDVKWAAWKPDSSTLAFIADSRADNDFELYTIADVTTADQTPTLVQGVPTSGDVQESQPPRWTPAP